MDRPDTGPAGRAGTRARGRHVPDPRRGQQRHRVPRPPAPLRGHDPANQPARAARRRARAASPQPACPQGAARRPLGGARRRAPRRPDGGELDAPQRRDGPGPDAVRARDRGGLGGSAGGPVAAARPLLYPLGGQSRDPLRNGRRGAAGPFRGRLAADRAAAGRGARRACGPRGARAPHRARRRRCHRSCRRRARTRQARARGDRADARRSHRLRPAAVRLPRPAHATHPDGHDRQVHGRLRGAVLARRGALRPGHERHRAGQGDLRQLAAGRLAGGPARLPRGETRARAGARSRG